MRPRRFQVGDTVRLQRSSYVAFNEFLKSRIGELGTVVAVNAYSPALSGTVAAEGDPVLHEVQLDGLASVPLTACDISLVARSASFRATSNA